MQIQVNIPEKFVELIDSTKRYNICHGGRAGGKSWVVAQILLLRAMVKPIRVLCCREFMNSIKDSSYKLLVDQIDRLKLPGFTVTNDSIRHANGSEILFKGLKNNIGSIKSLEGIDLVWCEEAQVISEDSWAVLIPTIRKEGSQFFITFNPEWQDDATYKRFIINPPQDSLSIKVNYYDNPFLSDTLRQELEHDRATDPEKFLWVWEGQCRTTASGTTVYGDLYNPGTHLLDSYTIIPGQPLIVGFDFGETRSGYVVCQEDENRRLVVIKSFLGIDMKTEKLADHCLTWINSSLSSDYTGILTYGDIAGRTGHSAATKTDFDILRDKGLSPMSDQKKGYIVDGVNIVRKKMGTITNGRPELMFVKKDNEFLIKGIKMGYVWVEVNKNTGEVKRTPKHDDFSHPLDALRYICVNRYRIIPTSPKLAQQFIDYNNSLNDYNLF